MKKPIFPNICIAFIFIASIQILSAKEYPYEWFSLGMSESPSTIQRVRWRTDTDMPNAIAELTTALPSPDIHKNTILYKAESSIENDYGIIKAYHEVTFKDLMPGTKYVYRIGNGDNKWSEWYEFSTAKSSNEPFSFIYISDVQVGIHDHYPRVIRKATMSAENSSFIMFTGDMTGGASEWEWNAFFNSNGWLFGMMPVVAIPDSHEYARREGDADKTLTTYWGHLFSYPENTPQKLLSLGNYYFDYQGCRFIMINTKELMDGTDEYRNLLLNWMEEKLASNPHKWSIVGQHQPVYSVAEGRNSDRIKAYLKPMYDKYDVDLVLSGHDHIYARMRGEENLRENESLTGPVYVVSVAGSQVYMPEYYSYTDRLASNTQLYQKITVSNDSIEFKAFLATGELYDHFLIKKEDKRKLFSDKARHLPEITDMPTTTWQTYTEEDLKNFRRKRENYIQSKSR